MSERLKTAARLVSLLVPSLTGLAASAMLYADYTRATPLFCEEGGGCDLIRQSKYAHAVFGFPTPLFGILGFAIVLALALMRGRLSRAALLTVASIGTGVAVFLLNLQHGWGVYCAYCVVADTAMLCVMLAATYRAFAKWDPPEGLRLRVGAGSFAAIAIAAPIVRGRVTKVPIPDVVAQEIAQTPKGKVTVVDFVDFECPFCRMTQAELEPVLATYKDRVRLVRKQVPLRMHPHAMDAARAACCGEQQGKGDAMADALFTTEDLSPEGCAKIAATLGLDMAAYKKCVDAPETEAHIKSDQDAFKASKGHGLPTIWVGDTKLEGAQEKADLESALNDALERAGS